MLNFKSYNTAEMLGVTPLSRKPVPDSMLWEHLLTPTVKALLGPITQIGEPTVFETAVGHFPGDESTNLNAHLIFGQTGFVRYPYVSVCYRTAYGALVIKRDLRKIKVCAWVGEVDSGKAELVYMLGLRDRRYDGSKAANDSALLNFPYDDAVNRPLSKTLSSLEVSIYSFSPGSKIQDADGDLEFEQFVEKPFSFMDRPETFLALFKRAWAGKRAPGQHAAPIKDVAKLVLPGIELVARHCGYDFLEAACSHYHVAMWFAASGFVYGYKHDQESMQAIAAGLKRVRDQGTPMTRPQQSWVCVLQNLPADLIPAALRLGVKWPQDNISPTSLWVCKALSQQARELALPLER